jgi:hypothetical protein
VHSGSFAALTISGGVHENASSTVSLPSTGFLAMFFVKTQRTPTQTDTTILSVYSLSLVTIITEHLILTKNSKSERFVHFFARERQSDSPRKTSTLRCQMQAQRPTFYIDCRKKNFLFLRFYLL